MSQKLSLILFLISTIWFSSYAASGFKFEKGEQIINGLFRYTSDNICFIYSPHKNIRNPSIIKITNCNKHLSTINKMQIDARINITNKEKNDIYKGTLLKVLSIPLNQK